ncbi:Uncharacterized conserved protein UCP015278 [Ruminiclostridium papyrosolvens DSM 2782]|uniref:Uncharacterized conserved protein UCP015278 n=1 Tax=Ruminiclostridium papyrosolvens DSM 2782 TaxID=588581 RepID=F1TIQ5_9FIRM|nr:DUF2247 family protein [Ruminiclostridium papyrosolvens]EGD45693.1 Uncharacterized conserved protein UCP015278 [Ruminiclostridium papyrosolvens DSM 2782]WES32931.1 DUF2247 family protein [Ruminiclostridium papyrosolvens DSM 2782]
MDGLAISVDYDFVSKQVKLTWKDILYGIEKKYLPPDAAIEHAITEVSCNDDFPQQVMDLVSLHKSESESVYPFLMKLANQVTDENDEIMIEKWLYLLLEWVYKHKNSYSDPLSIVEQLYADFDYPELIATFIRYMPSDEPDLGSLELNEARLYKKWKSYLDSQKERFSNKIEGDFNY